MSIGNRAFFVLDYTVTGGVERVTASLISLFNKNELIFQHLISLNASNEKPAIVYPDNLIVTVLFKNAKGDISPALSRVLIEKKITTLIFQGDNMTTALQVQRAAANAGCKAILHYHGSPFGYLKKYIYKTDILMNPFLIFKLIWAAILYPFKKIKLQKVINNAEDGFVCVSYGAANEIHAIYNLKQTVSSNIKTIHNPLTFKPAESVNNFEHKKKIIVYISRLHRKHKNSMLVLKAWQKIEKENPDWQLQIIGDGQLKNKMIKYVEDDKIKNVLFTGMVNNVDEFLIQSSISVLSSDCEGLGMGLLESAVYRNAIVATKSDGGVVDIVEDHITGYLVPRNNSLLFAEKLQDLILDKNTRERMGNSLYEKMQGFSDEKILAEWKLLLT